MLVSKLTRRSMSMVKHVYKVRFVLGADASVHTTYIGSDSIQDALRRLALRFLGDPRGIQLVSIDEEHGQFVNRG